MNTARLMSNPNTLLDAVSLDVAALGVLVAMGAGADDDEDPPPDGGAAAGAAPTEVGLAPGAVADPVAGTPTVGADGVAVPVALMDTLCAFCC